MTLFCRAHEHRSKVRVERDIREAVERQDESTAASASHAVPSSVETRTDRSSCSTRVTTTPRRFSPDIRFQRRDERGGSVGEGTRRRPPVRRGGESPWREVADEHQDRTAPGDRRRRPRPSTRAGCSCVDRGTSNGRSSRRRERRTPAGLYPSRRQRLANPLDGRVHHGVRGLEQRGERVVGAASHDPAVRARPDRGSKRTLSFTESP